MVNLCIRPFAEQFLKYVLDCPDIFTVIYTASPYEYAAKILPLLLPTEKTACSGDSRLLSGRTSREHPDSDTNHFEQTQSRPFRTPDSKIFLLCREDCLSTDFKNVMLKDLLVFEDSDLENSIIVDNSMYCYAKQLSNGIKMKSWYGVESDDEELRKLQEEIERWQSGVDILKPQRTLSEELMTCLSEGIDKADAFKKVVSHFGSKIQL